MNSQESNEQPDFTKLAIATLVGVIILGGVLYAAYRYSQNQAGNIVLPGGVTYLGPSPSPFEKEKQPPTAPLRFTAASDVEWKSHTGKIYPYSFAYPATLTLVVFPNDVTDSVAISWGNIPPQQNILLNFELIDKVDAKYVDLPKIEYVKNWYHYFSGLKGVAKVEPFTNTNGLKGYKAAYINFADTSPNTDIFFEVPDRRDLMIHIANGILEPKIFDRMIDSLKWTETTNKSSE